MSDTTTPSRVEFRSVLRIRPLKKAEKEDQIVLEPSKFAHDSTNGAVALFHPIVHMTSPEVKGKGGRRTFERDANTAMFMKEGEEQEFYFDSVLGTNTTQDKVHYSIGLKMALDAMEPLKHVDGGHGSNGTNNHLIVCMGVCNTGKTYTTFGSQKATNRSSGRHSEDGLVPRILESFFSQSQHHIRDPNLSFAVRIVMLHVQNDHVYDMLTPSIESQQSSHGGNGNSKRSGVRAMVANFERGGRHAASREDDVPSRTGRNGMDEVTLEQDPETHNFILDPTSATCHSVVEAREALQVGLKRVSAGLIGGLVGKSNRGHTFIAMQPVLVKRNNTVVHSGGIINVLDMAGIERVKKGRGGGAAMRDSIAANSSVSAVMHCLRTIKHNHDVIADGKGLEVFCEDDESDISNVSEEKSARNRPSLKKVPYLQSKLTMMLQPVFAPTASRTQITMLLAAYPGHRDYAEKKSLLADLELLRGAEISIGKSASKNSGKTFIRANTGFETEQPQISDVEESDDGSCRERDQKLRLERRRRSRDNGNASERTTSNTVSISEKVAKASNAKESRNQKLSTPSAPREFLIGTDRVMPMPAPPAFAPAAPPTFGELNLSYSSSPSSTQDTKTDTNKMNDRYEDPSPARSPKLESGAIRPNFRNQQDTRHPDEWPSKNSHPSAVRATVSSTPNIRPPRSKQSPLSENKVVGNQSPGTKWSSDSPLKAINKVVHGSKKKGKKAMQQLERVVKHSLVETKNAVVEEKTDALPPQVEDDEFDRLKVQSSTRKSDHIEAETVLHSRLRELETQNHRLSNLNTSLEIKCERLSREKDELTALLRKARVRTRQADWTALDEEEFRNSRRIRLQEQQLIRSPLRQHLDDVDVTHDIHSTWLKTGKKHFSLKFPSQWARAPDLDRRDRARGVDAPPTPAERRDRQSASRATSRKSRSTDKRKLVKNFKAIMNETKKKQFDLAD